MYRFLFFMPVLLVGMLFTQKSNKFLQCKEYDSFVVDSSRFDVIDSLEMDAEDTDEIEYISIAKCYFENLDDSGFRFILKPPCLQFDVKINVIIFHSDVSPPMQ